MAIRTAPVSQHSFAIRTAFVLHMRNKAMFNLFVRRMFLKFIRTAAKGAAQYRHTVNSRYSGHPGDGHLVSVIPRVRSNGVRRKFPNFSV